MSHHKRAATSAFWSAIENGGLAVISVAALATYTRMLSAADFGLFSVVLALVELFGLLVSMLFHDALVQRPSATELHFDTAFTFTLLLSLFFGATCWLLAPAFARVVHNPDACGVLRWMTLCLPSSALGATIVARQRRELAFRPLAIRSLIGRLSGALGGIILVSLGAGIGGLIAQQILMTLMGSLILWQTCASRPRIRFGRREFFELAEFGIYAVGALFLSYSIRRIFTIVSGIFLGAEAAGFLNLSLRVIDVFWSIAATAANQVALPFLANLQTDPARLKLAFRTATSFVCLILYFCFTTIAACAPELVQVLFGSKWLPSAPHITALALLVLVQAPRLLVGPLLTALGRPKDFLSARLVEFLFLAAALSLFRTPTIGWAVGIWVAREVALVPLTTWMAWRASGFGIADQFSGSATCLLASLTMFTVVLGTKTYLLAGYSPSARLMACLPLALVSFALFVSLANRALVSRFAEFFRLALTKGSRVGIG